MGPSVAAAWDLPAIRKLHHDFAAEWSSPTEPVGPVPALTTRTALVADWLALLRADPGLPRDYLDPSWPADASAEIFRTRRRQVATPSTRELEARLA
jgi:phenylacetic acid degradation operon negative regulatory protein